MNKKHFSYLFFISIFSICFKCNSDHFSSYDRDNAWSPKYGLKLSIENSKPAELSEKVLLCLEVKFDTEWNKKSLPESRKSSIVAESILNVIIKDVRIVGGKGKLCFKNEKDDKDFSKIFKDGVKVNQGLIKLWYIPEIPSSETGKKYCHTHQIYITAKVLDRDERAEHGDLVKCTIELGEPSYELEIKSNDSVAYIEDKSIPIHLMVKSNNPLAAKQNYKLSKLDILGGDGVVYTEVDGVRKKLSINDSISFGENTFYYVPNSGSSGNHKLVFTVQNIQGYTGKQATLPIQVESHRVQNFSSHITLPPQNESLLPFNRILCSLRITSLSGKENELDYFVDSIEMNGGKFMLEGKELTVGTALKEGTTEIVFDPLNYSGDTQAIIVIKNSKGDSNKVTFSRPLVISDPSLGVESTIVDRTIKLIVNCSYTGSNTNFILNSYSLSRGIEGVLKTITGATISEPILLSLGDNELSFQLSRLDINVIKKAPIIYFDIIHPDGTHHQISSNISVFVFDKLSSMLSELENESSSLYRPLVQDYSNEPLLYAALESIDKQGSLWSSRCYKLGQVLDYIKNDPNVSNRITESITRLNTLKSSTEDRITKRKLTSKMLMKWYRAIDDIDDNPSSKYCTERTNKLELGINNSSNIFESCRGIVGMEDIVNCFEGLPGKIAESRIKTQEKLNEENRQVSEEEAFKRTTNERIVFEQQTRTSDITNVNQSISSDRESRESSISSVLQSISSEREIRERQKKDIDRSIENEKKLREQDIKNIDSRIDKDLRLGALHDNHLDRKHKRAEAHFDVLEAEIEYLKNRSKYNEQEVQEKREALRKIERKVDRAECDSEYEYDSSDSD